MTGLGSSSSLSGLSSLARLGLDWWRQQLAALLGGVGEHHGELESSMGSGGSR
jgi:hypothetical protein